MRALSLKIQITLLVIMLVAGLVAAFSWIIATGEKSIIISEVAQRVVLQGRNLALSSSKPLLHEDPEFELHPLVSRVLKSQGDIVSIVVVDRKGRIKGHGDLTMIDKEYKPTPGLKPAEAFVLNPNGEELKENDEILEASVPVTDRGELIGFVHLQYSKDKLHETFAGINRRIIRVGLFALAAGALVSLLLAVHVARPVYLLTKGAEAIGQGNLDTRIKIRSVKEVQALAHTFNEMARSLKQSRRVMLDKERMEKELEIAHDIQETLLPSHLPHLLNFEIDAYYHPASQVGGDYFDIIPVDDRYLVIVVGDVAGKGVPGMVVMAMARVLVRGLALRGERPARLLRHLNVLLKKDMKKNIFVTLFCGLLDKKAGTLDFASAAHMPLLQFHSSEQMVRMIETEAKPLGLFPDEMFAEDLKEHRIELLPGDLFMQFTDGLNEMRNPSGEEFGMDRVMQVTYDAAAGGARHLLAEVKKRLDEFRAGAQQSDDLTLLAVSALPEGMQRVSEERMESLDRVVFD